MKDYKSRVFKLAEKSKNDEIAKNKSKTKVQTNRKRRDRPRNKWMKVFRNEVKACGVDDEKVSWGRTVVSDFTCARLKRILRKICTMYIYMYLISTQ